MNADPQLWFVVSAIFVVWGAVGALAVAFTCWRARRHDAVFAECDAELWTWLQALEDQAEGGGR